MPYIDESMDIKNKERIENFNTEPYKGPCWSQEIIDRTVKVQVVCSSYTDPGPDWCRYEAVDGNGNVIAVMFENGY